MTKLYNKTNLKTRRQDLRNNMPGPEVILWSKLQRRQLGVKFRRQYSVGSYILDFYCVTLRLAIELDGESHYVADGPARDVQRDAFLNSSGITVLRFSNQDVRKNLNGVLSLIYYTAQKLTNGKTPLDPPL
jgi:very-short-patch-repair endonuclease